MPAWLFVPKGLDRTKKHPAIVWIHGDGVNQGYDGWHVQRNYAVYYSFHQYLLQKGYVVIMPDYRGSIGYGKAWREGVYMDVGGKDAKDAWMVTNYLKTLPYVDMDRVGVWGLSYGGFFTLIAVTDQPKLFRAAVDVAGVADYAMYYEDPYHGGWTASRIGTPEQNPKVYANASPLSHMDRLERPLLVLHGTSDVNVPYLHSVRLIDELLKKGKGDLVSFMTYPGEFHYFTREHVLRDAWHRVEDFFDANLKTARSRATERSEETAETAKSAEHQYLSGLCVLCGFFCRDSRRTILSACVAHLHASSLWRSRCPRSRKPRNRCRRKRRRRPLRPRRLKKAAPEMTCPAPLGVGVKTKLSFCEVMAGRDPAARRDHPDSAAQGTRDAHLRSAQPPHLLRGAGEGAPRLRALHRDDRRADPRQHADQPGGGAERVPRGGRSRRSRRRRRRTGRREGGRADRHRIDHGADSGRPSWRSACWARSSRSSASTARRPTPSPAGRSPSSAT